MQTCAKCGKEIRYIAVGFDVSVACNPDKTDIITAAGHRMQGYIPHTCANEVGDGKNEQKN